MADAIDADLRALALPRTTTIATLDDSLSPEDVAATLRYADRAQSANTRDGYAADWLGFTRWCGDRGATPLPCSPGLLCGYLSSMAERGRAAATIARHAAAIASMHRRHGLEPPNNNQAARQVLRGIRRSLGTAPKRKAPATHDLVRRMMDVCPDTLIGKRDRAILALGLAGAFRRSELLALTVADLTTVPEGLRITIRRSKTDQTGAGQTVSIPHGARIRPVETLQAWLDAANIAEGPLFRPVLVGGRVQPTVMGDDAMIWSIKRRAKAAGLDPALFAGHSLRSGFLTSASQHNASLAKMMEVSRHRSVDVAMGYVRDRDAWRDHAGAGFL